MFVIQQQILVLRRFNSQLKVRKKNCTWKSLCSLTLADANSIANVCTTFPFSGWIKVVFQCDDTIIVVVICIYSTFVDVLSSFDFCLQASTPTSTRLGGRRAAPPPPRRLRSSRTRMPTTTPVTPRAPPPSRTATRSPTVSSNPLNVGSFFDFVCCYQERLLYFFSVNVRMKPQTSICTLWAFIINICIITTLNERRKSHCCGTTLIHLKCCLFMVNGPKLL